MPPDEPTRSKESTGRKRRMNWDFYYYEQQGNRFYKRYTPFAFILTLIIAVVGVIGFVIFLIFISREEPNNNITVPNSSSPSNSSPLRPTSPSPLPNVNRQFRPSLPVQPSPPTTEKNVNKQATPQYTPPQPTPAAQPSTPPP